MYVKRIGPIILTETKHFFPIHSYTHVFRTLSIVDKEK